MTAAVVDPKTGEILTMHDINVRMVRLLDELEASSSELDSRLKELGLVTFTYDCTYNAAVAASDAKSEDRRKAEATSACVKEEWKSGESLARAKARLEVQVRALRDAQHNVRAVLSGMQTLASNLRSEMSIGGGL